MSTRRGATIIVLGIAGWYPLAGVLYQCLHYLLGLTALGYDAYYVEDSRYEVYDPELNAYTPDGAANVAVLARVLERFGFTDRWAFRGLSADGRSPGPVFGMSEQQLSALYGSADAALNITGGTAIGEPQLALKRRVYVESDPFSAQVRYINGDPKFRALLDAHDTHFSFGENIGAQDSLVPTAGFNWLPTRQPVAMDLWRGAQPPARAPYTTITTWQNDTPPLSYNGELYHWTKDREFMAVIDLPSHRDVTLELAAGVKADVHQMLRREGWRNVDSVAISRDIDRYRNYIQSSRAEFTVARDQYVRPRTGWFSDRSACYLAAGRPVITQDTGFSKFLPTGRGLFAWTTMDDILAAIDAVESDYDGNCSAASEIADQYFAAERVVNDLLTRARL